MADLNIPSSSGTTSPYGINSYQASQNDKNTISITGYFQLLAAQLQNQDMTNPMDNSEIMAQMTQMAMVQSLTSMTEAIDTSTAVTSQTYAGGLLGQEVTIAITEEKAGQEVPVSVKYAKVQSIDFTTGDPTIRLEGDTKIYKLAHVIGIGQIPDPYKRQRRMKTNRKVQAKKAVERISRKARAEKAAKRISRKAQAEQKTTPSR